MSLANVAYQMPLTWGDTAMRELEAQALVPMLGEHPVEMGLTGHEAEVLARLRTLPRYRQLVAAAYPDEREPLTLTHVTNALAAFQRTLLSGNSAYDRARRGNTAALSESARRGYAAFFSDKLECYQCHGGMFFSNTTDYEGRVFTPRVAAQNLYGQDKCGGPPSPTSDVHGLALSYDERNRIKAPTLRNIGVTGPYMHDGTYATLDEMMDHYGKSGQATSAFKANCSLPAQDKADLIAFLRSLTDEEFLANPKHADPWPGARTGTPVRTSFGR
jgi:cytochrome c peroxidase